MRRSLKIWNGVKKICLDIRPTLKKSTGIGKYTLNLINSLAKADLKNQYYLYSAKKILDFKRRLPELPADNFHHCVDHFKKGPAVILPDADIFHTSSYDLKKPEKAKYILTIHDVIIKAYPHGHSKETIREIDENLKKALDEADTMVADSHNTKADLVRFYGVPESKVHVVYPGVEVVEAKLFEAKPRTLGVRGLASNIPYILFVGTVEPRKNIDGLIKAFNLIKKETGIPHKLYITGMKGWMYDKIFKEYERSEFKRDIVFKGYVNDAELDSLYKSASVFVYPSFYEGFGFPIVEAFSYGIPVVTSNSSSCAEIAGDSALLIDPSNYKEIGQAILKIVSSPPLRKEMAERGINRARGFSWDRTAREFVRLFTLLEK